MTKDPSGPMCVCTAKMAQNAVCLLEKSKQLRCETVEGAACVL